jgi:co-chaperonin GroES (HSP10)
MEGAFGKPVKLLRDNIFVIFDDRTGKQDSGLYIAETTKQGPPNTGKIYAVGSEVTDLKKGQRIVFYEPHPSGFKLDGHKIIPIKREQVHAIFEEAE